MLNVHLLIIDPQSDFCEPDGSLFVPGADDDMRRLATFVNRTADKITDIHVTLDSHHPVDIAHPVWWKDRDGNHPAPFTIITAADVKAGDWRTSQPSVSARSVAYVEQLEVNGRYPLCIWPPHCLIGSDGYKVFPELFTALQQWEISHFSTVDYVTKGSNPFTEHYSAVHADVPDPKDPSTQLNSRLIDTLEKADQVLIAGEAGSHCLANTTRDIVNNFGNPDYVKKLVLLEDATSPVPSFEGLQDDFIKDMKKLGMQVTTTTEWMKSGSAQLVGTT